MDIDEHVTQLESDGALLAAAAESAGLGAPVPATEWTVRELVTHVGGVHRWAADIVSAAAPSGDTAESRAVGLPQPDDALLDWFLDGHAALIRALRAAPPDLDCFTFLPAPSAHAFWARRQAHETAVHRADAQAAAGLEPVFDVAFAQDGIDELLNGFARRRSNAIGTPATLTLRASDPGDDWTIRLGGERIESERGAAPSADATVSGRSGDLYLWLWNRPASVMIEGQPDVAELWRGVRVRWS